MGEVYRARDTVLDREVAIKLLPEELSFDPERLARLEREAKLLASLNHPHIGAIYSLEEDEEVRFLGLELVEGDTLEDRLSQGRQDVGITLEIARAVVEAAGLRRLQGVPQRHGSVQQGQRGVVQTFPARGGWNRPTETGETGTRSRKSFNNSRICATASHPILRLWLHERRWLDRGHRPQPRDREAAQPRLIPQSIRPLFPPHRADTVGVFSS